jgi:hypothetical protein
MASEILKAKAVFYRFLNRVFHGFLLKFVP